MRQQGLHVTSSKTATGPSHFDRLPDELIMMIFRHFSNCHLLKSTLVCKRWRRIAYDTRFGLWSAERITKKAKRGVFCMDIASAAVMYGVDKLDAQMTKISNPMNMDIFPEGTLRHLSLWMTEVSSYCLALIIIKARALELIQFEDITVINEEICKAISKLPNLKAFHLQNCHSIFRKELEALKPAFGRMTSLNIRHLPLVEEELDLVTSSLNPNLKHLVLSCKKGVLKDRHVLQIVSTCSSLEILMLYHGTGTKLSAEVEALAKANITHVFLYLPEWFEERNIVERRIYEAFNSTQPKRLFKEYVSFVNRRVRDAD